MYYFWQDCVQFLRNIIPGNYCWNVIICNKINNFSNKNSRLYKLTRIGESYIILISLTTMLMAEFFEVPLQSLLAKNFIINIY